MRELGTMEEEEEEEEKRVQGGKKQLTFMRN